MKSARSTRFILIFSAFMAALLALSACYYYFTTERVVYNDNIDGEFSLPDDEYLNHIIEIMDSGYHPPYPEPLGKISSAKDARKAAERVWFKEYGRLSIIEQRPYNVYHDPENGVWFVDGTMPRGRLGGVASIIMMEDDGEVICLWHGK